jgi:hypothetical protein
MHVCAVLLDAAMGTKITHVPYRGVEAVQLRPDKSSLARQALAAAAKPSIFVQNRPDGSSPVAGKLPANRG